MKKLLILLFSLLISFNSYGIAKLAHGIIWHLVGDNSNGDEFYLDMESIKKKDGLIYYWILLNYEKPMDGYLSVKLLKEGDCSLKRDKTLQTIYHKEPMGGGELKNEMARNPQWIYYPPLSSGLFLMEDACNADEIIKSFNDSLFDDILDDIDK